MTDRPTHRFISLLLSALLAAGCAAPAMPGDLIAPARPASVGAGEAATPATRVTPPAPSVPGLQRFVASEGTGQLTGTVQLTSLENPFFRESSVPYRLQAMAASGAMITIATLAGDIYLKDGLVVGALTDVNGHFRLTGTPTDRPYLVLADLAGGNRLSAIVTPGASDTPDVSVDEASSMVQAMLRTSLPQAPQPGRRSIADVTAAELAELVTRSRRLVPLADLIAAGMPPRVVGLAAGEELQLRDRYVHAFGPGVSRDGQTDADAVSDAWARLLGRRPIALTSLLAKDYGHWIQGVAADADGNVFATSASGQLLMSPRRVHPGLWAYPVVMRPGGVHVVAGASVSSGNTDLADFDRVVGPAERAAVTDPLAAPATTDRQPLYWPSKLAIESVGPAASHVFMTSERAGRIWLIPATDLERYGRTFKAGRVYTLAGLAAAPESPPLLRGDGGPAHQAQLTAPTGIARDKAGNLFIIDNTAATALRVITAATGTIQTLPLTLDGQPFTPNGASDVTLVESGDGAPWLYIPLVTRHAVLRVRVPADLTSGAAVAAERVLGVLDERDNPGSRIGAGLADPESRQSERITSGLPKADVRLDFPRSLTFDGDGNMIIVEYDRLRLLEKAGLTGEGRVYPLVGLGGLGVGNHDALLTSLSALAASYDPVSGDVLLSNAGGFRLHTARGSYR